jgi:hypothetical protein
MKCKCLRRRRRRRIRKKKLNNCSRNPCTIYIASLLVI